MVTKNQNFISSNDLPYMVTSHIIFMKKKSYPQCSLGGKLMSNAKAYSNEYNNLLGALLILTHALAIAVLYGLIKELRSELSANFIMFLYKSFIFLMVLPFCLRQDFKLIRTKKLHLHVLRALLSLGGGLAFFYAVKFIELVDATAVSYLEQVFVVRQS